jgi:hypothetical protein
MFLAADERFRNGTDGNVYVWRAHWCVHGYYVAGRHSCSTIPHANVQTAFQSSKRGLMHTFIDGQHGMTQTNKERRTVDEG